MLAALLEYDLARPWWAPFPGWFHRSSAKGPSWWHGIVTLLLYLLINWLISVLTEEARNDWWQIDHYRSAACC